MADEELTCSYEPEWIRKCDDRYSKNIMDIKFQNCSRQRNGPLKEIVYSETLMQFVKYGYGFAAFE